MSNLSTTGSITTIQAPTDRKARKRSTPMWLLMRLAEEKELRFAPHPFRNIDELCRHFKLAESRYQGWRLTEYVLGHIYGLDNMRGRLMATDGIMCIIRGEHDKLHFGHLENFVFEDKLDEPSVATARKEPKPSAFAVALEDFKL